MLNKKWVLTGVGVMLAILAATAKTPKNRKKVDISISLDRTFVNEGTWYKEPSGGSQDKGDYYPQTGSNRKFYGTQYGVTAGFLVEFQSILQIPLIDTNVIRDLTKEQVSEIYDKTIAKRCRFQELENQYLSDLIFDWILQRPSPCIEYLCKIFEYTAQETRQEIDRGQFSDRLMAAINTSDPSVLYNALVYWRFWFLTYTEVYKSFRKGVWKRIDRYKDFAETDQLKNMREIARKKAFL
jgi:Glycosyl hydrolase 108